MTVTPIRPGTPDRVRHQAPRPQPQPDLLRAQRAAAEFLAALGLPLDAEATANTPSRMARAYSELLTAGPFQATTFPNDSGHTGLVVVRNIAFHSLCEHHAMPFVGTADVGYLPGDRIIGLSKLARIVDHHARRFQTQERLTSQIADHLQATLGPPGIGVILRAEHLCMTLRGATTPASTTTTAFIGIVRDDERIRNEFLNS